MKDKLIDRFIGFDKLLGITALALALVAAFFSVYGIATLFAGAFVLTAIMASALEIGKLVTVTFLYRYWQKSKSFLKVYLTTAAIVLMLITSLGIFGYLSAAYQKSAIEFKASQEKITLIEGQKTYMHDKIAQSKTRIETLNNMRIMQEARLNEGMTNAFLTRNPLQLKQLQDQTVEMIKSADENIKSEQAKIQSTTDEIQKIDTQVNEMKFASAGKKDIRTFQFVAEQFGTTLDTVAKWFIITLIFVFDPLAVALILAYNVVAYKKEKDVEIPAPVVPEEKKVIVNTAIETPIVPQETPAIPQEIPPTPAPDNNDSEFRRMFKI
jgi:hypothetical protein